jgi:hypothetical protein
MKELTYGSVFTTSLLISFYLAYILAGIFLFHGETSEDPNGLRCYHHMAEMSCNWDKYNHDTNYGKYPYATE